MNKLIGNTPFIKINYKYKGKIKEIYTKLEYYNLTGSIKDRMVDYVINKEIQNGNLEKGTSIIEATSGNTGISLAALGAKYKMNVYIFMPNWVSIERVKLMKQFGANVKLFSKEEGGFKKCINEAKILANKEKGFLLNQFSNPLNIEAHYEKTGKEIVNSLKNIGCFVSGIGSGGTIMGVGKRIKECNQSLVVAIEPDTMAILSNGNISSHKIEGIGDDFIPELVDRNFIDKVITINDEDAINMSRKLAKELGLGVGISSGANMLGAILEKENINNNVVTIFPDDNKKYLTTSLSDEINNNENFISNQIELLNYEII